jgi:hypothetical protein
MDILRHAGFTSITAFLADSLAWFRNVTLVQRIRPLKMATEDMRTKAAALLVLQHAAAKLGKTTEGLEDVASKLVSAKDVSHEVRVDRRFPNQNQVNNCWYVVFRRATRCRCLRVGLVPSATLPTGSVVG